jgi:hypothetical protein
MPDGVAILCLFSNIQFMLMTDPFKASSACCFVFLRKMGGTQPYCALLIKQRVKKVTNKVTDKLIASIVHFFS